MAERPERSAWITYSVPSTRGARTDASATASAGGASSSTKSATSGTEARNSVALLPPSRPAGFSGVGPAGMIRRLRMPAGTATSGSVAVPLNRFENP